MVYCKTTVYLKKVKKKIEILIGHCYNRNALADVAKLADALDLGSSAYGVGVRVPSSAPVL